MEKIVIVGAGGFGREVLWLIRDINKRESLWEVMGFLDDYVPAKEVDDVPVLGGVRQSRELSDCKFVVAFGSPEAKKINVSEHLQHAEFATLIHPTAIIAESAKIGAGVVVCSQSVVSINTRIGDHVSVNLLSTVGHDSVLGDYSSVMPGSNISGNVSIGHGVYIGTGAKIIHRITIGDESTIGAGSVVIKDVDARQTVFGNPARAALHK